MTNHAITTFNNRFSVNGHRHSFASPDALLRYLADYRGPNVDKKIAPCFCPVELAGSTRSRDVVRPVSMSGICIDVDNEHTYNQLSLDTVMARLVENNLKYCLWTSASHNTEKYHFADRFRVFVPYAAPWTIRLEDKARAAHLQKFASAYLHRILGIRETDASAHQLTHLQNLPMDSDSLEVYVSREGDGEVLDIHKLESAFDTAAKVLSKRPSRPRSFNEINIFDEANKRLDVIELLESHGYVNAGVNDRFYHPNQQRMEGQGTVRVFAVELDDGTEKYLAHSFSDNDPLYQWQADFGRFTNSGNCVSDAVAVYACFNGLESRYDAAKQILECIEERA